MHPMNPSAQPVNPSVDSAISEDHNLVFHGAELLEPRRCIVGYNDEITDLRYIPTLAGKPPNRET